MNKLALTFAVTLALTAAPAQAGFEIANRHQNGSKNESKGLDCIDAMGLDIMADSVFAALNPQVGDRKIRPGEISYAAQWRTIRNALAPNNCLSAAIISGEPQNFDNLADQVFYALHSELNSRQIRPHEVQYAREWSLIRDALEWSLIRNTLTERSLFKK